MRGLFVVVILLIGLGVWAFVATTDVTDDAPDALVDSFTLTTLAGAPITLPEDFGDKVVIMNSWASWCPFCIDELPDLAQLAREYPDDIVIVGINRQEPAHEVRDFLARAGLELDDIVIVLDETDVFFDTISGGFPSMPQTLFVRPDRTISTHKRGFMTLDEMRRLTEDALEVPEL